MKKSTNHLLELVQSIRAGHLAAQKGMPLDKADFVARLAVGVLPRGVNSQLLYELKVGDFVVLRNQYVNATIKFSEIVGITATGRFKVDNHDRSFYSHGKQVGMSRHEYIEYSLYHPECEEIQNDLLMYFCSQRYNSMIDLIQNIQKDRLLTFELYEKVVNLLADELEVESHVQK